MPLPTLGSLSLHDPSLTDQEPTLENFCFFQAFEWHVPADQKHWLRLLKILPDLKEIGLDNMWIPSACKGSDGINSNGYDIYDLWDLGEFDQKGSRSTKWGPKEDLMLLVDEAQKIGMGIYFDAILNHKAGADEKELCQVIEVDANDRMKEVGEPINIEAWLRFDFPGRGDKYSSLKYNWEQFSGTDYDAGKDRLAIFRILGENKRWSQSVGKSKGNADFLMFADVDFSRPEVSEDVKNWGVWVVKECKLSGFRLDACQHFSQRFTNEFIQNLEDHYGKDSLFFVGEYCIGDTNVLLEYLDGMHHKVSLFDQPLIDNFSRLSRAKNPDLRTVFDKTLVQARPHCAVTFVMNHDTQPGQTVETPVEDYFKPLAYALILFRESGYPEVFYGDVYGINGKQATPPSCNGKLPDMVLARKLYAYGEQNDYFDEPTCIGFVRKGTWDRKDGLACVMSSSTAGQKKMYVGSAHKGELWTDIMGWEQAEVKIDDEGFGAFPSREASVAVWVNSAAPGRDRFGKFNSAIYDT